MYVEVSHLGDEQVGDNEVRKSPEHVHGRGRETFARRLGEGAQERPPHHAADEMRNSVGEEGAAKKVGYFVKPIHGQALRFRSSMIFLLDSAFIGDLFDSGFGGASGAAQTSDDAGGGEQGLSFGRAELRHSRQQPFVFCRAPLLPRLDALIRQRKQDLPAIRRVRASLDQALLLKIGPDGAHRLGLYRLRAQGRRWSCCRCQPARRGPRSARNSGRADLLQLAGGEESVRSLALEPER